MIELGQKAEDKVTNFYGVIVARAEHLHGPMKYLIQPPCVPGSNVIIKAEWFAEERIRILHDRTRH
jgi:hypothetical protein